MSEKRDLKNDLNNAVRMSFFERIEALGYWARRVRELEIENTGLRDDLAFLQQEYIDDKEPVTGDARELKARLCVLQERDKLRTENGQLRADLAALRSALEELVNVSVILADERLDYVEIWVPRATWESACALTSRSSIIKNKCVKEVKKYTHETCPKSLEWFERGGRCGWAHECEECVEIDTKDNN